MNGKMVPWPYCSTFEVKPGTDGGHPRNLKTSAESTENVKSCALASSATWQHEHQVPAEKNRVYLPTMSNAYIYKKKKCFKIKDDFG